MATYETSFTADDKTVIENVRIATVNLLKVLNDLKVTCEKYDQNYGRAADILTVVVNIQTQLSGSSMKMLETE